MNKFLNFLIKNFGINAAGVEILGTNLVGLLPTTLNSTNAGGYMEPNSINGYQFNPADGKWYSTPPSPTYGNYAWSNPASSTDQATLNQMQYWRNLSNQLEGASPANGIAGQVIAPSLMDLITLLPQIINRYIQITPDIYNSLKSYILGSSQNSVSVLDPKTGATITITSGANGSKTIQSASADGKTLIQKVDSNADGKIDSVTTTTTTSNGSQIVQVDSKNSGVIDQTYVIKNGQRYNASNLKDAMQIDALIYNNQIGSAASALLQSVQRTISELLTRPVPAPTPTPAPQRQANVEVIGYPSMTPIGAFYEAKSAALDKALSIANQTGVLIGSNNKGVSATGLQALDANKDGKLSGTELAGLQVWTDSNENGTLDAGELKTVASAGIHQIASTDYSFYTKGNSVWANSQGANQESYRQQA